MRRIYSIYITGRLAAELVFVTTLVVGVYLTELSTGQFHLVANMGAGIEKLPLLLALSIPEGVNVAMPVGVLFAVYRVLLRLREDLELIALTTARHGMRDVLGAVMLFALACAGFTLWVGGYLEPRAKYMSRFTEFEMYKGFVSHAAPPRSFIPLKNYVFFGPGRHANGTFPRLIVFEQNRSGRDRIITAKDTAIVGPNEDGFHSLQMSDFTMDVLQRQDPNKAGTRRLRWLETSRAPTLNSAIALDRLIRFPPRLARREERSLSELVTAEAPARGRKALYGEAAQRVFHALLCLFAPALAVIALALSRPATQVLVLPVFCGVILGADLAIRFVIHWASPMTTASAVIMTGLTGALLVALWTAAMRVARSGAVLRPQSGQL